jgi:hypothetical protein
LPGKVARYFEDVEATRRAVHGYQHTLHPALKLGDEEAGTPVSAGDGVGSISLQESHELRVMLAPEHHQIDSVVVGVPANFDAWKTVCGAQSDLIDVGRSKYVGFQPTTQVLDVRISSWHSDPAGSLGDPRELGCGVGRNHPYDAELGPTSRSEVESSTYSLTAGVRLIGRRENVSQEHELSPEEAVLRAGNSIQSGLGSLNQRLWVGEGRFRHSSFYLHCGFAML